MRHSAASLKCVIPAVYLTLYGQVAVVPWAGHHVFGVAYLDSRSTKPGAQLEILTGSHPVQKMVGGKPEVERC